MTRSDLALAQFLLNTYEGASAAAEARDPKRRRKAPIVRQLDSLAHTARMAFLDLTGRLPETVSLIELSTTTPAAWTWNVPL